MNKQILNRALVAMGYRKMDKGTHYGKPIGFGIVICEINEANDKMTFKSLFNNHKSETVAWDHAEIPLAVIDYETEKEIQLEDKELFNEYTNKIAYGEYVCNSNKIIEYLGCPKRTFAFTAPTDYYAMLNA